MNNTSLNSRLARLTKVRHSAAAVTLAVSALPVVSALAYPFAAPKTIIPDAGVSRQIIQTVQDLNKDGLADLLVSKSDTLYFLRSTGEGNFAAPVTLQLAQGNPVNCGTGDFDNDGDVDLAVYTRYDVGVVVLRNNGNFTFSIAQNFPLSGFDHEGGVVLSDIDQDGDIDIGAGHYDYPQYWISWFPNDGKGVFGAAQDQNLSERIRAVAAADFNQDGRGDIARIRYAATLDFCPGGSVSTVPKNISDRIADRIKVADFDRDGHPDLLLSGTNFQHQTQMLAWSRWNGSGFATPAQIAAHNSGWLAGGLPLDMDDDGDMDVVYSDIQAENSADRGIKWNANNGSGQFALPQLLHATVDGTSSIEAGDVDGDGDSDLIFWDADKTWVSLNLAIHRASEFNELTGPAVLNGETRMSRADINSDGRQDLLLCSPPDGKVAWAEGMVNWPAAPALGGVTTIVSNVPGVTCAAAGDVDHDGDTDVVMVTPGLGQILLAKQNAGSWITSFVASAPAGSVDVLVADVDGDVHPDIVVGHATGATLFRNKVGTGISWDAQTVASGLTNIVRVSAMQMKAGGRMELLLTSRETVPARARGYKYQWEPITSTWQASLWYAEGNGASTFAIGADFNNDGAEDVMYALATDVRCSVNYNNGQMGASVALTGMPAGLRNAVAVDMNLDGQCDIVAAGGGSVVMALGKGDGTFQPAVSLHYDGAQNYQDVVAYDFDLDGDMDIAVAEAASDKLRLIRNHLGHYDLTESAAPVTIVQPGAASVALKLEISHRGITGDAGFAVRNLRLRFRKAVGTDNFSMAPGDGLTSAEAAQLFDQALIYRDLGVPGKLEIGTDFLAGTLNVNATSIGYVTITPGADASPLLNAGPGQTMRLLVVVKLDAAAAASPIKDIFFEHITDTGAAPSMIVHDGLTENWRLRPQLTFKASTRLHIPKDIELWRLNYWTTAFSEGPSANEADPDNDGLINIVEYVAGSNPLVPSPPTAPPVLEIITAGDSQQLWLNLAWPARTDAVVALERSAYLEDGTWAQLSTRIGNGPWFGYPSMQNISTANGLQKLLLVDGPASNPNSRGFYRLRVTELAN